MKWRYFRQNQQQVSTKLFNKQKEKSLGDVIDHLLLVKEVSVDLFIAVQIVLTLLLVFLSPHSVNIVFMCEETLGLLSVPRKRELRSE